MTLIITQIASRDIEEIRAYITRDSEAAARSVVWRLIQALKLIDSRPSIGRPVPGGQREWSVPDLPYVIPYRVRGDRVIIVRVFHTSRQRPNEWPQ